MLKLISCLGLWISFSVQASNTDPIQLLDQIETIHRSDSSYAEIQMIIKTPDWERKLSLSSWSLGDDYALIRILKPRKDKGVSTLKRKLEMWNYFPKINREIKVPPSMMMGSWMGSDFSNDDLVKQTKLSDEYNISLKEDQNNYHLSLIPKKETITVWGKIAILIEKANKLPLKYTYFDEHGKKSREMIFSKSLKFGDKTLPSVLIVKNLSKPGHSTQIIYEKLKFNVKVEQSFFSLHNLKKKI